MPEYISRETLRDLMYTEAFERDTGLQRWDSGLWIRFKLFENCLDAIPAADVVEVVHASWMAENSRPKSGIFYCSCCHRTCYDPQPTRAKGWTKRCRYHYCPNCGAKMDGGQDDG